MEIEEAKLILNSAVKSELQDHAFGDCEVYWTYGENPVAFGYFSGTLREVCFPDGQRFMGETADKLRQCFASEEVERNDETGPERFELGKTMPGLTQEGVLQELTEHYEEKG